MDKEFNLLAAVRTLLKWKKNILVLTVVSGLSAGLFSVFVMDEWFFSYSTFYPNNMSLSDRGVLFGEIATYIEYFGGKADVNRILTIANSNPVLDYVIDSFHIAEHYKIDKSKPFWRTMVRKKFEKKYEAIKTERDAIQISLYDTDPKLAADIINTIVHRVDEINKQHAKDAKSKQYEAIKLQTKKLQVDVTLYSDSLARVGERYNIKVSSGADGTVIIDGKDYKAVQLYKQIMSKQSNGTRELNNLNNIIGQIEVANLGNESSLYVLETAIPADRREKPVRSLVVLVTVMITLFIALISALLFEQITEIRKQL